MQRGDLSEFGLLSRLINEALTRLSAKREEQLGVAGRSLEEIEGEVPLLDGPASSEAAELLVIGPVGAP